MVSTPGMTDGKQLVGSPTTDNKEKLPKGMKQSNFVKQNDRKRQEWAPRVGHENKKRYSEPEQRKIKTERECGTKNFNMTRMT